MRDSQQNKQDCEQFLQAFEKPTQIYRFLRRRHHLSPLFLQRNLSYLKDRITKRKFVRRQRKPFDLKTFLEELKRSKNNNTNDSSLVFKFIGYYDGQVMDADTATTDIYLLSRNKHQPKLLLKSIPVDINPSIIRNPTPITISKKQLMRYTSKTNKTCTLLIEVSYVEHQNNNSNVRVHRSKKRRKISHEARLPVFNQQGDCDLLEGEYELKLSASDEIAAPVRKADQLTWAMDIPTFLVGKSHTDNRTLKFFLHWGIDHGPKMSTDSPPIYNEAALNTDWCGIRTGSTTSLSTSSGILSDMSSDDADKHDAEVATLTIKKLPNTLPNTLPITLANRSPYVDLLNINSHLIYRFIYNNNLSQKTETCDTFLCPWCYLNCMSLHPLLMHLRLCHDRFKFSYTQQVRGIQVDVSINERYSCALSPTAADRSHQSSDINGMKPCKRKSYTKVLVSRQRAKKSQSCRKFEELDEAIGTDESDAEEDKFVAREDPSNFGGHGRLYYRTTNNLKYTTRFDFDEDSEGEMDPGWLQNHTKKYIDEFSDVNEGEKEMLKMWNLHVMKHNFVGDSQMPLACEMFVHERGDAILSNNLYRNFLLHLTNLHDYGMLSPGQINTIVQRLLKKRNDVTETTRNGISNACIASTSTSTSASSSSLSTS